MTRNPKPGDLIYIGKKNVEYLVVDTGSFGVPLEPLYRVWFDAVRSTDADPITGSIDGAKVKTYFTAATKLSGKTKLTPLDQLQLVGTAKFKKTTKVSYMITKIKSV